MIYQLKFGFKKQVFKGINNIGFLKKYILYSLILLFCSMFQCVLVNTSFAADTITVNPGQSYEFINNDSIKHIITNNSSSSRYFDYAVYKLDATAYQGGINKYSVNPEVPAGGRLVVTVPLSSSSVDFGGYSGYFTAQFSETPALCRVTLNPGQSYEFTNHDSVKHSIANNSSSSRYFDYTSYNQDGTAYQGGMNQYNVNPEVPAGGRLVVTVPPTSSAVDLGGYNDFFTGQVSETPALCRVTLNPGQSYEFTNHDSVKHTIANNSSSSRYFDYVTYNQDGTGYQGGMNQYNVIPEVPAGGRLVVTVPPTSSAIDFGGCYTFFTGQESNNPALIKVTLSTGQSYEFINKDSSGHTVFTNGSESYNRKFDFAIYKQDGTSVSSGMSGTSTSLTVPAGGKLVVTVSGANQVEFGGALNYFNGQYSNSPALLQVSITAVQSYEFKNIDINDHTLFSSGDDTNNRKFDYVIYRIDGTASSAAMASTLSSFLVPAGGRILVTVLSTSNPVEFGGYYNFFTGQEGNSPAFIKATINAGQSYEFINIDSLSHTVFANISDSNNQKYDYSIYNIDGTVSKTELSSAMNSQQIPAGGKLRVTVVPYAQATDFGGVISFFTGQTSATPATNTRYTNIILDAFYSGANGQYDSFYGGYPVNINVPPIKVTPDIIFNGGVLTLPTGSYVTVGLKNNIITNQLGNDIYVEELSDAGDQSNVYVSSNDRDYVLLGVASGGRVTAFDLSSIGFNSSVSSIKIVGLDNNGTWPGFDLLNIRVGGESINSVSLTGLENAEQISAYDNNFESMIADPVDSATGAHVLESNLLTLQGAIPVTLKINYNSLLLNQGPLGKGWDHNYETSLEILQSGTVIVHWSANRKNTFINYADNMYYSSDISTCKDSLVKNFDGSYTLTRQDQTIYQFNGSGQLLSYLNGHGQKTDMEYDNSGNLVSVTEPLSGKKINFVYDTDNLIEKITDNLNRQVSFTYDADHNLTGITNTDSKTTTYTYNANSQVLTATDAEGIKVFTDTYDDLGRIITQDDGVSGNPLTQFSYDESSQPGKVVTTVTDRNGGIRVLTHDSNYRLLSITDELGNITTYTYDTDGNRTSATDENGHTTNYTYDERGNMLTSTNPAGSTTTMTYDERNNPLSMQNTAGNTTAFIYDESNNPLSITDPMGKTTAYTYDENGLMLSKTSPGSGTTSYAYQNGLLKTSTDPAGNTTTYSYDAAGRLTGITDAAGNTTAMAYDSADNLTSITDPLGNTASYTYDSRHNKLSETDPNGNTTQFEYNGNGKLIKIADPLNQVTTHQYDGEDRLIGITNARGSTTTYTNDAKGRLIRITDPLGHATSFQYDPAGNMTGAKDALGNQILTTAYDNINNPISIIDALGNNVTKEYDNLSRLTQTTDPLGRTTVYSYDELNRLVSSVDPISGQSSQGFDTDGNLTEITDPNGNQTSFSYDNAGRLTSETSACYSKTYSYNSRNLIDQIINGRGQAKDLQYDAAGRLTSFTDPEGSVDITYDANGNILTVSDSTGAITRQYDALNRVTRYTDTRGNTIQYSYDEAGNLTALTYPDGKKVQYTYNEANRLTMVTDWAGRVTDYEYDANSRLTRTSRPDGSIIIYIYDEAGQLIRQKDTDSEDNVIAQYDFTYDSAGNVISEQPAATPEQYTIRNAEMTYTSGNRLASYNGEAVQYDADGNMTIGPLNGAIETYAYDSRNRLTGAGDNSYIYDAENNRISVTGSVYQTSYIINPQAALSQVLVSEDNLGNKTWYVYGLGLIGQEDSSGSYRTYHYDRRGSTVALTDDSGTVTDTFQYGPYGELVKHNGATSTPFLYNGRDGVMTDENGLYFMRARYYSTEARRFVNQDILLGSAVSGQSLNRYAYVNGQPVIMADPFGLCGEDLYENGKHNFLYYLWDEYNNTYYKEPIDRWLESGVANIHSFRAGEYGNGLQAYLTVASKYALITGKYLVEQSDAFTFGFLKNPTKIVKTVVRAGVDSAYETKQAELIKKSTDQYIDTVGLYKGSFDIVSAENRLEAIFNAAHYATDFNNFRHDY